MKCGSLLPALMLAFPASALGANAIGVFTADDCATGEVVARPGESVSLSICLHLEDGHPGPSESSDVYVRVAFRIAGLPESWNAVAEPVPGVSVYPGDDPLDAAGTRTIAPIGEGSVVPLYTLTLEAAARDPVVLQVGGRAEECAYTQYSAATVWYEPVCADTTPFTLTVTSEVPVERTTWSRLKTRFGGSGVLQDPPSR